MSGKKSKKNTPSTVDELNKSEENMGVAKKEAEAKKADDNKQENLKETVREMYKPKNIDVETHIKREVFMGDGTQKIKHIMETKYKNGVIKRKCVGISKLVDGKLKKVFDRGVPK